MSRWREKIAAVEGIEKVPVRPFASRDVSSI